MEEVAFNLSYTTSAAWPRLALEIRGGRKLFRERQNTTLKEKDCCLLGKHEGKVVSLLIKKVCGVKGALWAIAKTLLYSTVSCKVEARNAIPIAVRM